MKYFIVTLLIILAISAVLISGCAKNETPAENVESTEPVAEKADCAVCGMTMNLTAFEANMEYEGKTYYFCTKDEMEKFQKDPQSYISGSKQEDMNS